MKNLFEYIDNLHYECWDNHVHFFDYNTNVFDLYNQPGKYSKIVGFADICLDKLDEYSDHKIIEYYDDFIQNRYDKNKHILLATADNSYDAINIYLKYPDIIRGFGEFKCYKVYRGEYVKFGNLNWIRPVCEFDKELRLPIYIHWCFENLNDVSEFESLLKDYPSIPFILCHCGMGYDKTVKGNSVFAYEQCIELQSKYKNLYFDISYKALDFFTTNHHLLKHINNRVILGSDLNPKAFEVINDIEKHKNKIFNQMNKIHQNRFNINSKIIFNSPQNKSIGKLSQRDFIISEYLKNIEYLPIEKQQHFITRLNLSQPMNIDKYMNIVIGEINDIISLYKRKQYRKIVMSYVINPYVTTNDPEMKKVADWITSITDENLLKLLAVGIYADKSSIVTRNGFKAPEMNIDIDSIYEQLINNKELYLNEGTLYINCAGYLWNLYKTNIESWRKIRRIIIDGEKNLRNIYGVTHILLQASNFYTCKIDNEYKEELNIVNDLLTKYRLNGYKDISLDLLCELALCLKYSKFKYNELELVTKYINDCVNNDEIIYSTNKINNHIQNLINNEHTNALYILLK